MTLGNRIYKYRTEHGLSRESIAEKCSVSSQSIQKWESDNSKPSLENLIMLSKIFNPGRAIILSKISFFCMFFSCSISILPLFF